MKAAALALSTLLMAASLNEAPSRRFVATASTGRGKDTAKKRKRKSQKQARKANRK